MTPHTSDPAGCLPVFCWRPDEETYGISVNFGDALFPMIVERILQRHVERVDENHPGPKVIAGGSALHCAHDGDVIWGAGLRTEEDFTSNPRFHHLRVAAVRGPITRDFLLSRYHFDVPEVFGDPAILLPQLFPEWRRRPVKGRIGVIPHFSNRHEYTSSSENLVVVFPNQQPQQVVPALLTCELVIAGSLHGLIVAEAFGIPARWLNSSRTEPELKYYDYYQGTDRYPHPVKTVSEAEELGGELAPRSLDPGRLLESFPRNAFVGHRD